MQWNSPLPQTCRAPQMCHHCSHTKATPTNAPSRTPVREAHLWKWVALIHFRGFCILGVGRRHIESMLGRICASWWADTVADEQAANEIVAKLWFEHSLRKSSVSSFWSIRPRLTPTAKLEIWPQRPRNFAAVVAVHRGGRGDMSEGGDKSVGVAYQGGGTSVGECIMGGGGTFHGGWYISGGGLTLVLTWLIAGEGVASMRGGV